MRWAPTCSLRQVRIDPSTYDKTVLDELKQRQIIWAIGDKPDIDEVATFLRRAANGKATGLSGAAGEYYKAISFDKDMAQVVTNQHYTNQNAGHCARTREEKCACSLTGACESSRA